MMSEVSQKNYVGEHSGAERERRACQLCVCTWGRGEGEGF